MKFWPFNKKKKVKKVEGENLKVSDNFAEILSANKDLESQFQDLINRFERRIWTPEVCFFFKTLAEDLFRHYGLHVEFQVNCSSSGTGSFSVRVIND